MRECIYKHLKYIFPISSGLENYFIVLPICSGKRLSENYMKNWIGRD